VSALDPMQLAPYLFGPGNAVSALAVGRGKRWGWLVLVAVQLAMVTFGFATGYAGFSLSLIMAAIGAYNYRRWRRREVAAAAALESVEEDE